MTGYANQILLLIADKRFCRAIVGSSPGTALAAFIAIGETKKYGIQVGTFARNVVNEALTNRDSFLFHEAEGYDSGLIGYAKPLSQAMFSNYSMLETIGTLLDPAVEKKWKWDAVQWEAYCRVVLITFKDYVEKSLWTHSFVLVRAMDNIQRAASDLYKVDGIPNIAWDEDVLARLRVVVEFIKDAVKILDKKKVPKHFSLRVREKTGVGNVYDHLASMIVEVILYASSVKSPPRLSWWIQHNSV